MNRFPFCPSAISATPYGLMIYGSGGYIVLPDYISYKVFLGRDKTPGPARTGTGTAASQTRTAPQQLLQSHAQPPFRRSQCGGQKKAANPPNLCAPREYRVPRGTHSPHRTGKRKHPRRRGRSDPDPPPVSRRLSDPRELVERTRAQSHVTGARTSSEAISRRNHSSRNSREGNETKKQVHPCPKYFYQLETLLRRWIRCIPIFVSARMVMRP